jgi:WD40 repeat protein
MVLWSNKMSDREAFRKSIEEYLKIRRINLEVFAGKLGYRREHVSRMLHGKAKMPEGFVHNTVRMLAKLGCIRERSQARRLLRLMDTPDFSLEDWNTKPLAVLDDTVSSDLIVVAEVPTFQQGIDHTANDTRTPTIEPPSTTYVHRREEFDKLKESILRNDVEQLTAITSALKGAGGYGKTTLAQALCYDEEIRAVFPDGIEWITLGESVTGRDLVTQMKDLIYRLSERTLPIDSPEVVRAVLREVLEQRRILLVLDDVWHTPDLKPFLQGGMHCARLITTRNEGVIPANVPYNAINVDAMTSEQAVELLYKGLGSSEEFKQTEQALYELAHLLKKWPLLLSLANGILYNRIKLRNISIPKAISDLRHLLEKRGLTALDPEKPAERHEAVSLTLEISFALLSASDLTRYLRLAIFPENVTIPLKEVHRLWSTGSGLDEIETTDLCLRLYSQSLLRTCDVDKRQVQLHDVVRGYLLTKVSKELPFFQQQFLSTHKVSRWADLPDDETYLWQYLVPHLIEAQQLHILRATVTDLSYLAKKIYILHSAYAAEADIEQAEHQFSPHATDAALGALRLQLAKIGDILYTGTTLQEVESTLLSYVYHIEGLSEECQHLQEEINGSFLIPWHALPDVSEYSLIRTFHGHTGAVNDCAISPDGTWLVSASTDKTLKVWDVHTGALRFTMEGHLAAVLSCTITPAGNRIISTSTDGTIKIWNAYTGNELLTLLEHKDAVNSCAISSDGTWLVSASDDKTLKIWDIRSINGYSPLQKYHVPEPRTLHGHGGKVISCAISPDATWLASTSSDWTIRFWNLSTGQQLPPPLEVEAENDGMVEAIYDCTISPDGTWLVTTSEIGLKIWDVTARTERCTTYGHVGNVVGCGVSPDGTWMISTSVDGTMKGWRTDSGLDIFIFKGHMDTVNGCTISPQGDRVVSASDDHTLKLWEVPPITTERLPDEEEYAFALIDCAISPTGDWVVSISLNEELKRWNLHSGIELDTLTSSLDTNTQCRVSPDGTWILTASEKGILKILSASTGTELLTFSEQLGQINGCAISPDGTWILTSLADGRLTTWDVQTGRELLTISGHEGAVNSCAISPDGTWIVSAADDRTLKTWDARQGVLLHTFLGHTERVRDCAISPKGEKIVSVADDGTTRVWQTDNPKTPVLQLKHTHAFKQCLISSRGDIIVTITDKHILIWDVAVGTHLSTFYTHSTFSRAAFHPDGEHLVVAAENGLYFLRIIRHAGQQ